MFKKIHRYLDQVTPERHPEMQKMEAYARKNGFPIIGPLVGRFLYQMAVATKARKVFEMGSGYGYSAFWFSLAMGKKGQITLTDGDKNNKKLALSHFEAAGLKSTFDFRVGDARRILARADGPFDIILNDIDKEGYPDTINTVARKLRKGGLFITDNVIWSGKVCDKKPDKTTRAIIKFTDMLYSDERFFTTIMPIRDGIAIAMRR